jgi:AcrR family transcriptional regulator
MAGRPRSATAERALLDAARHLVVRDGYEAVTVAQIAHAAGAGRQTIYRRWPSKAELVLDALLEHARTEVDAREPGDRPVRPALTDFLADTFTALAGTATALRGLMAQAQGDPVFRDLFRDRFIRPRRAALRRLLVRARQRGELRDGAAIDVAVAALYGALWYRLLLDEPLDRRFARQLTDTLLAGLGADPPNLA